MRSLDVGSNDVFVDDFIQAAQGGARQLTTMRRHLLHAVDEVLSRPAHDEPHRNEAVSIKKMKKGDGSWSTRKLVLGWILDTARMTIELPPHRKEALADIFKSLVGLKRISRKRWESILGRLRFVSVAIPGSAGLFCALQLALQRTTADGRIRITRELRQHIDAFSRLAAQLAARPTHLSEIVPEDPIFMGATDAAKAGMGGVFFDHTG